MPPATARAAVLASYGRPLELREFPLVPLADGEVRVRVMAAGVCGSDVHIWRGEDPRTPLPLILGHEGVGCVDEIRGAKQDVYDQELRPGDLVLWERGITCGRCAYCVIRKQPALCPHRRTYGISVGCADAPHLRGAYAEYIHLRADAHLIRVDGDVDPAVLVSATCSGACAAHAIEQAHIRPGDAVLVLGPGPMAMFLVAFARERGAGHITVIGSRRSAARLAMAQRMGADSVLFRDETSLADRLEAVRDQTHGFGACVVFEASGSPEAVAEAVEHTAPYGTCLIPGIAVPVGRVPVSVFEHIARKNVRLQGVWVSDTSHLCAALDLVLSRRYPFDEMVTHRFPLDEATGALEVVERREAVKAVVMP
ncbi:MAG TPA: zinc-binding dehydrogenase [Armatimonadota bacterium]|nr:zinc-binding dehydrogenase [Armatimonadota bacterium]